ncbi:MAG: trigger factor [Bacteroidota bacterium]|nr:trigger factor [Bacteroidota bacterium]
MGTVTREHIGLLNDKITVKIEKSDYLPSFEKALKEYGKKANIPGFRKGMVPTSLIKKMYGSSVFTDEVLKSVEKKLTDYMSTEQLDIFAQPLPLPENDARQINMGQPDDYSFAFEVGLKPAFQLPDLASLTPTRYQILVTDEMLNNEIDRLQVKNGTMTEPESVSSDENVLNLTFQETDSEGNAVEGSQPKENSLLVKYFSESFRPQLLGKKKTDEIVVQPAKVFDDKERAWVLQDLGLDKESNTDADKYFKLTITKVGLVEKAALDETFFKKIFPSKEINTAEDFRDAVKEDMASQWKVQTSSQLHHTLYHELLDKTQVEFPESFLKRWLLNGGDKPKTAEEVEHEFPAFVNALKWSLITEKINADNVFEVGVEEVRGAARQQLFSYLGGLPQGGDQPWVEDYVNKMMQDRRFVDETYQRLKTDKMLVWLESQVKPVDQEISAEDFNKLQQEHQHLHAEEHIHEEHGEGHEHGEHEHQHHD